MKSKKSQMEILGLAVVVILLILIMVFVVRMFVLKQPADYKGEYTKTQLASNTVNAFLKTTTKCHQLSVTELLSDCAENEWPGSIICNGVYSCVFLNETAAHILNQTLDTWNMKYSLSAFLVGQQPLLKLGEGCPGVKESELFTIPTNAGAVYVKIDLC